MFYTLKAIRTNNSLTPDWRLSYHTFHGRLLFPYGGLEGINNLPKHHEE